MYKYMDIVATGSSGNSCSCYLESTEGHRVCATSVTDQNKCRHMLSIALKIH